VYSSAIIPQEMHPALILLRHCGMSKGNGGSI
jgi:hypothetical protein